MRDGRPHVRYSARACFRSDHHGAATGVWLLVPMVLGIFEDAKCNHRALWLERRRSCFAKQLMAQNCEAGGWCLLAAGTGNNKRHPASCWCEEEGGEGGELARSGREVGGR